MAESCPNPYRPLEKLGHRVMIYPHKLKVFSKVGFRGGASGEEPACQCRRHKNYGFNP